MIMVEKMTEREVIGCRDCPLVGKLSRDGVETNEWVCAITFSRAWDKEPSARCEWMPEHCPLLKRSITIDNMKIVPTKRST
jgi:hypothetical protein